MARLRLSCVIDAAIEEVYQYVTAYGREGPVADGAFEAKYGADVRQEAGAFIVTEDVRRYPEDEPELVTWRYTFTYPTVRTAEALDSTWANRRDTFRSISGRTLWTIQWDSWARGPRSIIQYLAFRLVERRRITRELLDPVNEHFARADKSEKAGK